MLLTVQVTDQLIARFRADLSLADFSAQNVDALWGSDAAAALRRTHRIPALRALRALRALHTGEIASSAVATLAQVFVLGTPVTTQDFAAAVPSLGVMGAVTLGLVRVEGDSDAEATVFPLLDIRPYPFRDAYGESSWWIASDLGEVALGHAIPEKHVLGVGGASLTLANLMVTSPVDRVLDLGTGCGILALHASRFANRVIATDISARALDLARFNAALNDITSIEFRMGSLFDPVAGERFDRIITNPPFVITPRSDGVPNYDYRDGGLEGDAIVESVIRGVENHLAPGGIAQLLGNWEYHGTTNAFERIGGWLDHTRLDAWAIEREVHSIHQYAETWIRDGGTKPGTNEFDALYSAWLDDFEARGVTGVGFGYVNLRRPGPDSGHGVGSRPWRSLERIDGALASAFANNFQGLGAHIAAAFASWDWLSTHDDELLGRSTLSVAADVTEERHYWPGDDDPTVITLRQGGGLARTVPSGTLIAAVVGACDGELSVRAICAAVAEVLELDEAAVTVEVVPGIRELIQFGMLTPEV